GVDNSDEDLVVPIVIARRRYANVNLFDAAGRRLTTRSRVLPTQVIRLRLDIGDLSPTTLVWDPTPIPDQLLPKNVDLDVIVSSTDFLVSTSDVPGDLGNVAHGRFFLPGDGSASITADGSGYLDFGLTAPDRNGFARCRVGYYYKNNLVQSQQIVAAIGQQGGIKVTTDFTLSEDLTNLDAIPQKMRLSVLTNW